MKPSEWIKEYATFDKGFSILGSIHRRGMDERFIDKEEKKVELLKAIKDEIKVIQEVRYIGKKKSKIVYIKNVLDKLP